MNKRMHQKGSVKSVNSVREKPHQRERKTSPRTMQAVQKVQAHLFLVFYDLIFKVLEECF